MSNNFGKMMWCCLPTVESECYNEHFPAEPWQGKLIENTERHVFYIARCDEHGNPILKDNTVAFVKNVETNVFDNEADCWKQYLRDLLSYLSHVFEVRDKIMVQIEKANNRLTELNELV